jgi:malate synthase
VSNYFDRAGLRVDGALCEFVETELLPSTYVSTDNFWHGYAELVSELAARNANLLARRDDLQGRIDRYFLERRGRQHDAAEYEAFLREIGYLVDDNEPLTIETENVDPEIGSIAGPQLVVPVMNARFALNAANARWGSLYDALYGTDAIPQVGDSGGGERYNPVRGAAVIFRAKEFLDAALPLKGARHVDVNRYALVDGLLEVHTPSGRVDLSDPAAFRGYAHRGTAVAFLFRHQDLHFELVVDRSTEVGTQDAAGISDIVLESALTTIQDCEDSVAAVDAEDKVVVYRNWLGLMRGDLQEQFTKGGREIVRRLSPDRTYIAAEGHGLILPGRSLMLVRNVGHLMLTDAVLDAQGNETPEGFLDAMVTVAAAIHDLGKTEGIRNSRVGSIYVVKPKMHGPDEVAFADLLFSRVEAVLGLAPNTVKIGVMDEERRTTVNLRACMRAAKRRLAFINTGFLDRTGDEIHTSMQAGPVVPKGAMRSSLWLAAYEDNNVDQGLVTGLPGRGQIGKGMWAKPDAMAEMLNAKISHPQSGASTAWVPSPTAATLHAIHYHLIDVASQRDKVSQRQPAKLSDILTIPLLNGENLPAETVSRELNNNAQSILGYVVRWIDQGVGCSKVPDIDNVALMEDRATLRISAQHIANWLLHGLVAREEVEAAFRRMAAVVDNQNAGDPGYTPMAPEFADSVAFQAALELVLDGVRQPNGYTEPVLHRRRREAKARLMAAE